MNGLRVVGFELEDAHRAIDTCDEASEAWEASYCEIYGEI